VGSIPNALRLMREERSEKLGKKTLGRMFGQDKRKQICRRICFISPEREEPDVNEKHAGTSERGSLDQDHPGY